MRKPTRLRHDLDEMTNELLEMAMAVEAAVRDALRSLDGQRPDLAKRIIAEDSVIDREEVRIEEDCIRILVLEMPVAEELRRVIAVLKINGELERIADLAVDIAEEALAWESRRMAIPDALATMADRALEMVRDSLNAFVGNDLALARSVLVMDDEVNRLHRRILDELKASIRTDLDRIDGAFHLAAVARRLERIADHATNVAEDVVYLHDGEIIRHRPAL
jgi:phosphate transport system protein